MREFNHILTAIAALGMLSVAPSVRADEALLSPRARANQIRVVPSSSAGDKDLVQTIQYGNAKAQALANSLRSVPGTGGNIDLAHGPRPLLSPKDPRYNQVLREMHFQLAPLK